LPDHTWAKGGGGEVEGEGNPLVPMYVHDRKETFFLVLSPAVLIMAMKGNKVTGIRGGSCNPSYWEVDI
jgi:hypothetical protein